MTAWSLVGVGYGVGVLFCFKNKFFIVVILLSGLALTLLQSFCSGLFGLFAGITRVSYHAWR